jgi:uncharacterized protein
MMKLRNFGRVVLASVVVAGLGAMSAGAADDIAPSHLKVARKMLSAIAITSQYDTILPRLAMQLKQTLIQASPNYERQINEVVDEKTLELAVRRGDLEKEAAKIYAKAFTEEELNQIADFYTSPVGQKLLRDGPLAARELSKAADIWGTGVTRDLSKAVDDGLEAKIGAQEKAKAQ